MPKLNLNTIPKLLAKSGYHVKEVLPINKKKTKVCRVTLAEHPPAMLKIWPFYPLRFTKVIPSRAWWEEYRWKCTMPFNESRINHFVRQNTDLITPDIYHFERIFPLKSIRFGYLMLQEDLSLKKYTDLEDLLKQLIAQKAYDHVFYLVEKVARILQTLFALSVYNEDAQFKNFMVDEQFRFALIDFERFFQCNDPQKMAHRRDQVLACCEKNYRKMTNDDPAFSSGFTFFQRLRI